MSFATKLLAVFLTSLLSSSNPVTSARVDPKSTLLTRLKLEQVGSSSCWDALFELQSCSGEVVLFFLNGEANLGANCCRAIRTIEHQCWPSMLGSLGITPEESGILSSYCDSTADGVVAAPPPTPVRQCYSFPRLMP